MTPGKKLLITAAVAIAAGAILIALWALSSPRESPAQRKARRLWAELRRPGPIGYFLIDSGIATRPNVSREYQIVQELAALGPPAVPYLIRALDHASDSVRNLAAEGLGHIGPEAEAAAPKLLDTMKRDSHDVRFAAAKALVRIGRGHEALPFLTKMLASPSEWERYDAAMVLRHLGPLAEPAIPELIGTLEDAERLVRDRASRVLARIGPPAVPALMKALEHPDSTVREHAAWALGEIGPGGAAATTALERAMKDKNALVRKAAAEALKRIRAKRE